MTFKVSFIPDEEYYRESYGEIIAISKYKKWVPLLAILMILYGLLIYFLVNHQTPELLALILIGFGVYELFKFYHDKRKWLRDRLESKIIEQVIEMEFDDEVIRHSGPFSNGEMKWSGIKIIKKSKKGIIFKPETGIFFYLPDKLFKGKDEIEFILSKKNS